MRDVMPSDTFEEIKAHLRQRAASARSSWESANEDEDTLTGAFGETLRTDWKESKRGWSWRVTYKKFRGRGPNALEHGIGADGIVQIEVQASDGESVSKGVLFQAKKIGSSSARDLPRQVATMERLAPGATAIFEYGPDEYRASAGSGGLHPQVSSRSMSEFLAEDFLECKVGQRGMYHDAVRGKLIIPAPGGLATFDARVKHRIRMEVASDRSGRGAFRE